MDFPLPPTEDTRLEALYGYEILDTEPEQAFDDLVHITQSLCQTPIAVMSLVDADRQWFKSRIGITEHETERACSFCTHTILTDQVMVIPDATQDPRFKDSRLVTGRPHIRFYAGAPLITEDGLGLGAICAIDTKPRQITGDQILCLEALARQIVSQLDLRKVGRRLVSAVSARDEAMAEMHCRNSELTQVLASIHSILITVDGRNVIRQWNPAAAAIIGVSGVPGTRLELVKAPWHFDRISEAIDACRTSGKPVPLDDVSLGGRLLGLTLYPLEDRPYGPGSVLISGADITEKVQSRRFVNRQATLLSAIRSSIPWGFMVADDVTDEVLYTNEPLRAVWGLPPGRLAQPDNPIPATGFFSELGAAAVEPARVRPLLAGSRRDGLEELVEQEIELLDGRVLHESSLPIHDDEGCHYGRLYHFEDITHRKQRAAETKRRHDFENLLAGLSTEFINIPPSEVDERLVDAFKRICEFTHIDRLTIFLLSANGETYELRSCWERGDFSPQATLRISIVEADWLHQFFLRGQPVFTSSVKHLPPEATFIRKVLEAVRVQSALAIPLNCSQRLLGFISFGVFVDEYEWLPDQIAAFKFVAQIFANALVRKDSDEQIRRLADRALRESEERLQAVIASAPVLLVAIDLDGTIALWEGQTPGPLQVPPAPVGSSVFGHWDHIPRLHDAIVRALDGETFSIVLEVDDFSFEAGFRPILDEGGKRTGAIAVITDITEWRQFETRLALAEKMQGIGQLAAGVAHEINTPMQYLSANTYFLKESFEGIRELIETVRPLVEAASKGKPAEELAEEVELCSQRVEADYLLSEIPRAIGQSVEGIDHVSKIVSALKEFCHPAADQYVDVDINHLIENTLTVTHSAWRYVADVGTHLDPDLPLVKGIPGEIVQALANILVNAADAVQEEIAASRYALGHIQIETKATTSGVEIRIADNGPGVPAAIRSRIFELFFTTKESGRGTGQGLAITHRVIAEKHGGTIDIESKEGTGSTFVLRLPLHPPGRNAA